MYYLNSLPHDVEKINLSRLGLTELPDLSRFYNLKGINCSYNMLTELPELPLLTYLDCSVNKLTVLPELPLLTLLDCSNNQLTLLPELPLLTDLYCYNNKLSVLPEMPNLIRLGCSYNKLSVLPEMPNLIRMGCSNNPIHYIIGNDIKKLRLLQRFRHLYFSLKYKGRFVDWLWEKVRKPKIEQMYHPSRLIEFIDGSDNWDERLDDW